MSLVKFFQISILTAAGALIMIGCITAQKAQTMNENDSNSNKRKNADSAQPVNGQTKPAAINSNANSSSSGDLAKYKDKKIETLPTKPVSLNYIIQHRTALNDKIVTVSGVIVSVPPMPDNNSVTGVRSMANPQPRIFIADDAKKSRDTNRDVLVIVDETDKNYAVNEKVTLKVRVSGSKAAVVLRKVS